MPIPTEHRRQLDQGLRLHQRLLNRTTRDLRLHETMLRFGRDPRVLAALDEFSDNRETFRTAAANPRRFAQERGVDIPPEVDVKFAERQQTWFVGFESSSGLLYGYEGGEGGRGCVNGEPEEPEDGGEEPGGGGEEPGGGRS
jgi:hypothetical protein